MTSVVDTSVKFAVSSMQDAPVINGMAGSLIAALDAFLVNGFANKQVTSGAVSGGVCRLNFTGQSAAMVHSVILVAGITGANAAINGEQKVTAVSSSWVEFKTDLPDGAVTGSVSFKMAPLGWEKVFAGTNKAVYRPTDSRGTRPFVKVDDSNALYARVTMYESMTDVDSGLGQAPLASVLTGGYYWHKRQTAGGSGAYWLLAGDSRGFYCMLAPNASSAAVSGGYGLYAHFAGDLNSFRSGDPWCSVLTGAVSATYTDTAGCIFSTATNTGITLQRLSSGLGSAVQVARNTWGGSGAVSGNDSTHGAFPSRSDNGLRLSPIVISDGAMSINGPRGELPGVYHCTQSGLTSAFGAGVAIAETHGAFSDLGLASIGCGGLSAAPLGCGFIALGTPWRAS